MSAASDFLTTIRERHGIVWSMQCARRHVSALLLSGAALLASTATFGQTQAPPPPTEALRPVLVQVGQSVANVNVNRWKAPGDVKSSTTGDMESIQRDLNTTLPPLLDAAAGSPGSTAASFAVYRNIDALYDVLLRVSQTAVMAGAQNDAVGLQSALDNLQSARKDLGSSIMDLANSHDQELARLRTAAAAAARVATPPPPPAKNVIDDGPQKPTPARRKKKPATNTPPTNPQPATSPQ